MQKFAIFHNVASVTEYRIPCYCVIAVCIDTLIIKLLVRKVNPMVFHCFVQLLRSSVTVVVVLARDVKLSLAI